MAHYEDLEIDQGKDASIDIYLVQANGQAKDLSGHTATARMALNYDASDSDKVDWTANIASPATDGIVNLSLTNAETLPLNTRKKYVYDVSVSYLDSDLATIVEKVLEGTIKVKPSVS